MQLLSKQIRQTVSTGRIQWAVMISLCLIFCASAQAQPTQQVSLGWDTTQSSDAAGYSVHYGTASGIYTSEVDAGTNDMAVISGLIGGITYYFVVLSYDTNGVESVPSNEISYTAPTGVPPTLAPVADQTINMGEVMRITNSAVGADGTSNNLSFTLLSAPAGMRINPTNGIVSWTPDMSQAGTTNSVVEQVSDTNAPPLTSVQSFTVLVGNAVQTILASAVISVGQSGSMIITMNASNPISNLSFTLDAPAGWVTALTVQPLLPQDAIVSQNPPGAVQSQISVQPSAGQVLQGQIQLQINLTSTPGQTSAFGWLQVSSVTANLADGSLVPTTPPASSRLVFVGTDSLMDLQVSAGSGMLTVYGPAGASYQIQSTTDLSSAGVWTNEFSTTLTNIFQSFPNLPVAATGNKFYRAQRL